MENQEIKSFCEKIADRDYCSKCRNSRIIFATKDKTPTGQKSKIKKTLDYCPPYIGFWDNMNQPPNPKTDVLIITESHGGGNWEKGLSLDAYGRAKESHDWHLFEEKDKHAKTFFQWNIKKIIQELDKNHTSWFVTDLVKCYIFKNNPKKKSGEINNFKEAIKFCSVILKDQIKILDPKLIVGFGGDVKDFLKSIDFPRERILPVTFPSQNSANAWAKNEGDYTLVVEKIIKKLSKQA